MHCLCRPQLTCSNPLSSYALPTPCPVLKCRNRISSYAVPTPCTVLTYAMLLGPALSPSYTGSTSAIPLRASSEMCGTELGYGAMGCAVLDWGPYQDIVPRSLTYNAPGRSLIRLCSYATRAMG
eukprot:676230-Rhodomonas_salina.1